MRAVLFQFYTIETIFNLALMFLHIDGFLSQPLDALTLQRRVSYFFYCACFYAFTVLIVFASIDNCTGHRLSLCEEVVRNVIGFVMYVIISLMTLEDAEQDFNVLGVNIHDTLGVEKPVHPFFIYMRYQAAASLACGVMYLLHATIAIDVLLSNERGFYEYDDADDNEGSDYIPARIYFMSEWVQSKLEQYEWFQSFSRSATIHV
ncbi:PREDICTED: uncharacterized protein LOC108621777 [Drosophila arizonae]|uniref:Uncharacterized protein LOC108621777 n=1 Tax=Drosophila arizonae TaxID=7263 RepID=A0ABM1Q5N6_DROAR|nr:PREDICTED: uncharacterized protein LOC108621777 [Drosophila arizonae]